MHTLSILLVLLIGGTFIGCAAMMPFLSEQGRGWRRWSILSASCLMVVGGAGFFGAALSSAGGLNWLPNSFEWPVGYTGGVVSTADGLHIVPHTPSARIQVYDANWSFLRGWHVDAGGGTFKVAVPGGDHIEVITARGQWHYVFDTHGRLISKSTYRPRLYDSFPAQGESVIVPTRHWLWTFTHPFISWIVIMIGAAILVNPYRTRTRKPVIKPIGGKQGPSS